MFVLIFFYPNIITFQTLPQPSDSILLVTITFILTLIQSRKENIPLPQVMYMTTRNKRVPVIEKENQNKQTKNTKLNEAVQKNKTTKQNIIQMQNKIKQTETKTKQK